VDGLSQVWEGGLWDSILEILPDIPGPGVEMYNPENQQKNFLPYYKLRLFPKFSFL
jgi:hypothetical protein